MSHGSCLPVGCLFFGRCSLKSISEFLLICPDCLDEISILLCSTSVLGTSSIKWCSSYNSMSRLLYLLLKHCETVWMHTCEENSPVVKQCCCTILLLTKNGRLVEDHYLIFVLREYHYNISEFQTNTTVETQCLDLCLMHTRAAWSYFLFVFSR